MATPITDGESGGARKDLSSCQIEALKDAVRLHGRQAKEAIRRAWMDGGYYRECLARHTGPLQSLRNERGPSWLCRVSLKAICASCP